MNQLSPVKAIRRLKLNCIASASRRSNTHPLMRAPLHREVSFGRIQVVEFAPALGDNPSVSKGAPIALGTKKIHEMNTPVDVYECARAPLRRHGSDLAMKPKLRARMYVNCFDEIYITYETALTIHPLKFIYFCVKNRLLSEGYDKAEINDAAQAAWTAKKSIEQSASMKHWDAFHERMETTRRVLKRVVAPVTGTSSSLSKRELKRSASLPKTL
jgi:hypothetical protein